MILIKHLQSIAPLQSVLLGIMSNPQAQQKAQEELDRVLGPGTLPGFNHQDDLPYVTALVKEVLRWHEPAPIGEPASYCLASTNLICSSSPTSSHAGRYLQRI